MAHSHHHKHSLLASSSADRRYLVISVAINLVFVALEAFIGWRAASLALVSDAGHNLSDVLGIILAIVALTLRARGSSKADKASHWITLVNAGFLLVAVAFILVEAVERLGSPASINADFMIWTAAAGIIINGATAYLIGKGSGDNNVRLAFLHAASDALVSVGVVISGFIIKLTGWGLIDILISVGVSVVILIPTIRIIVSELRSSA